MLSLHLHKWCRVNSSTPEHIVRVNLWRVISCTGDGSISSSVSVAASCTWALYERRTHCHSKSCSFYMLRPHGHCLFRAFASVYSLSQSAENAEITVPTALYGVRGVHNEVIQSLILRSAELGGSSYLVTIKMVLQDAGMMIGCLSWRNMLYELLWRWCSRYNLIVAFSLIYFFTMFYVLYFLFSHLLFKVNWEYEVTSFN